MRVNTNSRYAVMAIVDLAMQPSPVPAMPAMIPNASDYQATNTRTKQRISNKLRSLHKKHSVTLASIAERQNISPAYLEQIFAKLKRHNLVISHRGPGGGYSLARDPANISIAEIIIAVEGSIDMARTNKNDDKGEVGTTHRLWENLNAHINDFLTATSIQTLLNEQHAS